MANNAAPTDDRPALLMTRPRASAEDFVASLSEPLRAAVRVCHSPLMEIRALGSLPDLSQVAAVIFTSANGVDFAGEGLGRPCHCVGDTTAARATSRGWQVHTVSKNADSLVATLARLMPEGPLLHLSGRHQRGQIAERLTALGIRTDAAAVYDQPLLPLSEEAQDLLSGPGVVLVPLFSPRTAAQFAGQAGTLRRVRVLCISAAVAEPLQHLPLEEIVVAAHPDGAAMRQGLEMMMGKDTLP